MVYSAKWRRRDSGIVLFKASPASLPSGATFTRSTTATYVDTNGVVQTAGANALRSGHYIGGVQTILLEGSRTNSVLWSRDLTNAAWSGPAIVAQNAVGLDGTANSATTVTDNDPATAMSRVQSFTVPVDSNTHTVAYWIKKDTDQTRFPGIEANIGGGTLVQRIISLNTQTGTMANITVVGTSTARVVDAGLWWVVEITVTNNATALNTSLVARIYPALGTTLGGNSVTPTGSCVVGHVQVELNSPFYSSPIFTTTAAVTRGADSLSFPIPFAPQAMTLYAKGVIASNGPFLEMGTAASGKSLLRLSSIAQITYWQDAGTTSVNAVNGATTVAGDTDEVRGILNPNGSVQIGASVNGAAEVVGGASAASSFMPSWTGSLLINHAAGADGFAAFQSVKIAAGVQSLATMRTL